jgi:histidinol-phosphate aminotransferase
MAGTDVVESSRSEEFDLVPDEALETIERLRPDIVFVCSPNNPTGNVTSIEDLGKLADAAPGLFVVDEAYFEFCGVTFVPFLEDHPNTLVVRTLSKAFRLAGLRFGYGVAAPEILEQMGRVRMPYAQSSFAQEVGKIVLRHRDEMIDTVKVIVEERGRLEERLAELPDFEVTEGGANFVFVTHPDAKRIADGLHREGIVIRDFTALIPGGLRITAGTPPENDELLQALTALV